MAMACCLFWEYPSLLTLLPYQSHFVFFSYSVFCLCPVLSPVFWRRMGGEGAMYIFWKPCFFFFFCCCCYCCCLFYFSDILVHMSERKWEGVWVSLELNGCGKHGMWSCEPHTCSFLAPHSYFFLCPRGPLQLHSLSHCQFVSSLLDSCELVAWLLQNKDFHGAARYTTIDSILDTTSHFRQWDGLLKWQYTFGENTEWILDTWRRVREASCLWMREMTSTFNFQGSLGVSQCWWLDLVMVLLLTYGLIY